MDGLPAELTARIDETVAHCRSLLEGADDRGALERARGETLGKKGRFTALLSLPGTVTDPAVRRELGRRLNEAKNELTALLEARLGAVPGEIAESGEDITLPGRRPPEGALHPLTVIEREVLRVMASLGFEVTEGPEVEDERHNFDALNIPPDHPARDEGDNFYVHGGLLLRSQTSTVQIRTLESRRPPLRIVAPGRVFRPDEVDATHHYMFHQVEGLAVDEGLTLRDLESTLLSFLRGLFGTEVELRLRPSFFPFTEPSAEVDVYFPDKGQWVEIGGCGMVDPAVFQAVGLDPERYTGFAFGLGLERLAMRRFRVPDIRLFTENDLRFLRQLA